ATGHGIVRSPRRRTTRRLRARRTLWPRCISLYRVDRRGGRCSKPRHRIGTAPLHGAALRRKAASVSSRVVVQRPGSTAVSPPRLRACRRTEGLRGTRCVRNHSPQVAFVTVEPTSALGPSVRRRLVLLLMTVASAAYVGRVAVTVVAPAIIKEFGLTSTEMGTVFSAFLAGYTLFQVPSGVLA